MSQLQLLLLLTAAAAWLAPAEGADALVTIDGSIVLAETHPTSFLSFSFDTTALFGVERTAIPFSSTALQKMSAHLAPAYLRLGGSLEDGTAYNVSGDLEPLDPPVNMTMVYLNSSKWDEVVSFTTAAQLDLVFGLNAAIGRQSADPNAHLAWNASNIQSLLNYVVAKGQNLTAVELGNEVLCHGAACVFQLLQLNVSHATSSPAG